MSYAARGALRSVKNVAKGYTEIQAKVREATSNDPGPVNTELMRQIASASHYDQQFVEIMIILEKRLNDDGRNWRHVYKALALLEFLILRGSDRILQYARDNFYVVKTLKEFQFRDEAGADHGQNVRQKAVKVSELLTNDELLQRERAARRDVDDRVSGRLDYYEGRESPYATGGSSSPTRGRQPDAAVAATREEEDVRRAIEESLKTAERERSIRSGYSGSGSGMPRSQSVPRNVPMSNEMSEEEQLQRAIEMSKRDEEERQRRRGGTGTSTGYSSSPVTANRNTNNNAPAPLIDLLGGDDHPIMPTQPTGGAMLPIQPTGASDPFALPQGNPFTMLAAQPTGYTAVSSQMTGYSAGGSDPFAMQQQPMPTMPTGNPFGAAAMPQATGSSFAPQLTGSPFSGPQLQPTSTGSAFNPFTANVASSLPMRPSSTPPASKGPMVDLDNLGPPNRNPFAMTTNSTGGGASTTSGGAFNWTNEPEQPKLSLAQMAQVQQQQRMMQTGGAAQPFGVQQTGPAAFGGVPQQQQPFGVQQTGPAAFGGGMQQPFGMQPTGMGMGMQQTGSFGVQQQGQQGQSQQQQQQQQQQNNPFAF